MVECGAIPKPMIEAEKSRNNLPFSQAVAYGSGNVAGSLLGWTMAVLLPVFNLALGVNPALVGVASSLPRLVDLFTDPLAGYLSDSLRRRFRRGFFIAAGSVFGGLFYALLWLFPMGLSPNGYFAWILVITSGALIGWSFVSVPLQALAFEMTEDGNERTRLMAYSTVMGNGALMIGGWAYVAAQSRIFGNTVSGVHFVGGAIALVIVIFGLISASRCKGSPAVEEALRASAGGARSPGLRDFLSAAKRVGRSRPFMLLTGAIAMICLGCFGAFSATGLDPYIMIFYVKSGDQVQGMILAAGCVTANSVAALVGASTVPWVARRTGRKKALLVFLGVALAGSALKWVCYNQTVPWLALIPNIAFGFGMTALWVLIPSMTADISDLDELLFGTQDAGMYSAFYMWTVKVSTSLVTIVSGSLLVLIGFNVALGPTQSHHTLFLMRIFGAVLPMLALAGGMALISRYPIKDAQMATVHEALRKRRALAADSPVSPTVSGVQS